MDKPKNLDEYVVWSKSIGAMYSHDIETNYELNIGQIKQQIEFNEFFRALRDKLDDWESEYVGECKHGLFLNKPEFIWDKKKFNSVIGKSYRANVIINRNWPSAPKSGWVTHANFYSIINDLIRCKLVCKFADGPLFLIDKMKQFSDEKKIKHGSSKNLCRKFILVAC